MTHQDQELELEMDDDQGQGQGPNPPRQTRINVTLTGFDAAGKAVFGLQPAGDDPLGPPEGPYQTLTFRNQDKNGVGHNGLDVSFVFTDATGQGYTFPPNNKKQDAISSQLGALNYCPLQGMNEVFSVINVGGQNNNTLNVHDANQNKQGGHNDLGDFSYVLWVTKDNGANYVPLDPGGKNMNGPTS